MSEHDVPGPDPKSTPATPEELCCVPKNVVERILQPPSGKVQEEERKRLVKFLQEFPTEAVRDYIWIDCLDSLRHGKDIPASSIAKRHKQNRGTTKNQDKKVSHNDRVNATPLLSALAVAHMDNEVAFQEPITDRSVKKQTIDIDWIKSVYRIDSDKQAREEWASCRRVLNVLQAVRKIRGHSTSMQRLRVQAWNAALGTQYVYSPSNIRNTHGIDLQNMLQGLPVHIHGESGVGKELVAQVILAGTPFLPKCSSDPKAQPADPKTESISLAGFPDEMIYSELFGIEANTATGVKKKKGLFERNHGGSVFIDEIADISPKAQASMLRTLESGRARAVGAAKEVEAAPRVITASHKNIEKLSKEGSYRRDLYFRLSGITIHVPALREHREDIPNIVEHIIKNFVTKDDSASEIIEATYRDLSNHHNHPWHGNIRELSVAVTKICLGIPLTPFNPDTEQQMKDEKVPQGMINNSWTYKQVRKWYAQKVLLSNDRNKTTAAKLLGTTPATLSKWTKYSGS